MEKRYQVFISSTFKDLQKERTEVIQALLELDCIPSGMELFPAADDDQWTYIQKIIDDCDYYVVVLAGKYGTISDNTGKSYTQMEYEYACSKGKPVIGFLHEKISDLKSELCEQEPEKRALLEKFRGDVGKKLCKYWANSDQLGAVVSRSMVQLIKQKPAVGWVRANLVADESSAQEIARLRRRIEELESQATSLTSNSDLGFAIEDLAQGNDRFTLHYTYKFTGQDSPIKQVGTVEATWDQIFLYIASRMGNVMTQNSLTSLLNSFILRLLPNLNNNDKISTIKIIYDDLIAIRLQLRILGLIIETRPDYWQLTPKGEHYMIKFQAIVRQKA